MQKTKKQKQTKTLSNPIPQNYIKSSILIEQLFVHPSELLYIIIDSQGYIQLFDLPTMSLIGKSFIRLQQGYQVFKCMFSKQDVGLFYILYRKCIDDSRAEPPMNGSEFTGENKNNRKLRWNYILNLNYLTKKNEIITSTCKLQLNSGEDQQNMEVVIEKQMQNEQQNQIHPQNSYLTIQNQRNTFLRQYYNEEGNVVPQRQNDEMSSKLELVKRMEERQLQEELIKEKQRNAELKEQQDQAMKQQQNQFSNSKHKVEQKQNDICKQEIKQKIPTKNNQQVGMRKLDSKREEQILENPKNQAIRKEMPLYKTVKLNPILQISKYIRTPLAEQKESTSIPNYEFTILYENGFHICTQYEKISAVQLQNQQIVAGVNIYGNADSYLPKNQQLDDGNWQYSQTGTQYDDVWIVFTTHQCLLIELNSYDSQNLSQLQMEISTKYYSQPRRQQSAGENTIYTQTNVINSNVNYGYMYNSSFASSISNTNKRNKSAVETRNHNVILDPHKKLCLVINARNQIILISYHRLSLCIIGKLKLDHLLNVPNTGMFDIDEFVSNNLNFMTILRFGVNTNTTNKYQNKVMVLIGLNNSIFDLEKEKQKQRDKQKQKEKDNAIFMQDEIKPKQILQKQRVLINLKPTCNVYIYSFQLQSQTQSQSQSTTNQLYSIIPQMQSQNNSEQLVTIFKQFPQILQIWYSEYLQNQLSYLTLDNHVEMIDLCRLLEGKSIGKEWVNLGYRFQPLDNNEQYEQLQDEFQLTAEQSKDSGFNLDGNGSNIRNKISQLNDWSYCLYSRQVILSKKLRRLNIMDF